MSRTKKWLIIPLGFAVLALGATLVVDALRPDPVMATVIEVDVIGSDGRTGAEVEWVDEEGRRHLDFVVVPEEFRGEDVVPALVHEDGSVSIDDGGFGPRIYLAVGIIALGFGLVVEMSLRGLGYVRGTGRIGETPDLDVAESHGFYWRT